MAFTLDPATEQRVQRELASGRFREPSALIAHALDLVEAEREDMAVRRAEIAADLEESWNQAERGEGYSEDQLRARMTERRAAHQLPRSA